MTSSRRRLAVVTTVEADRLRAALPVAQPHDHPVHPGPLPGTVAVLVDGPGEQVPELVDRIRSRLTVGPAAGLVGAAVGAIDDDPQLLLEQAGEALLTGHGVADDTAVRAEQARRQARPVRAALRRRYLAMSPVGQRVWLVVAGLALGWLLPFAVYCGLWFGLGVDLGPYAFFVVFAALLFMAGTIVAEALRALEPDRLPDAGQPGHSASDPLSTGRWPTVTVIVSAYLPNEVDVLPSTVQALLHHEYAGQLDVIVAGNGEGPEAERARDWLRRTATYDARLRFVDCRASRSKAENVNTALHAAWAVCEGGVVGLLDADHQLAPGAITRAARWVAGGYADVVQGHNVVRNGDDGWLQRTVAVEFEAVYAVAHPGRAGLHGFGIFGGSNGFWRADLLDRLRMRPWMLTEDIDSSLRAVQDGARITSDPRIVSRELAPDSIGALWDQRMRWAQGWHQASRRHLRPMLNSRDLTRRQRVGAVLLLGWREAYPWLAVQMFPLLAYQVFVQHTGQINWLLPFFVFTGLFTTGVGPLQAMAAWRLSVPEIRRRRGWFLRYLLLTGAPYGEAKAAVNRSAHLRQWLGVDAWVVTSRSGLDAGQREASGGQRRLVPAVVYAVDRDGVLRAGPLERPDRATAERRRRQRPLPAGGERRQGYRRTPPSFEGFPDLPVGKPVPDIPATYVPRHSAESQADVRADGRRR